MSWILSLLIALLTALVGAIGAGAVGARCVRWFRWSNREGGAAYFLAFITMTGALLGFLSGGIAARMMAMESAPDFLKALAVGTCCDLAVLGAATLICWWLADLPTTSEGQSVVLQGEIRCPVGFLPPPDASDGAWYSHIDTRTRRVTSRSPLRLRDARHVDGRIIIPMTLDVDTSVREKLVYIRIPNDPQLFIPIFSRRPGARAFQWSAWQDGDGNGDKPESSLEERFSFRFKLEKVVTESTPPEHARSETIAPKAELDFEQTELANLSADSSLEQCLKFTHYSQPEERRLVAGAILARRRNLVAELTAQILSSDAVISDRALRAVPFLRPLPVELARPVQMVGEEVIKRIARFNESDSRDHHSRFTGASEASLLFSSWFQAHHALHDLVGVNGVLQLKQILDVAAQRPDSFLMREDIGRVAQYYVHHWTTMRAPRVRERALCA